MRRHKHIEIVSSSLPGLSSMSLESRTSIAKTLSAHYDQVGITIIDSLTDLEALVAGQPDLVVLGAKFIPQHPELGFQDPDKIWLSQYLEDHAIDHTGSRHYAHSLEFRKQRAKRSVTHAGLRTSPFFVARRNQVLSQAAIELGYPVFIKPCDRGGGLGVDDFSLAWNFDQVKAKVHSIATRYKSDALVEHYLPGREFSISIIKQLDSDDYSVVPLELSSEPNAAGVRMLSKDVKSSNSESVNLIADELLRSTIGQFGLDCFLALGARDYGRIDVKLDAHGQVHFLEANLMPSLISGYGTFPKACQLGLDLDYEAMLLRIVELGLAHPEFAQAAIVPDLDQSPELERLPVYVA